MININQIKIRKEKLSRRYDEPINMSLLSESFIKNGNLRDFRKIISNYESISTNTSYTMDKINCLLSEYAEMNNSSKIREMNRIINEEFLPILPYKVIQEFIGNVSDIYDKELFKETANEIKICDRINSNNNKLFKTSNLGEYLSESTIGNSQEAKVIDICNIINKYNMNNSIKMNVAIENGLYNLCENSDIDIDNALITMYEYFALNKYDTDKFIKLVNESKLLTEEQKDLVLEFKNSVFDELLSSIANNKDNKSIEGKIKTAITKMFSKSEKQILEDLPNLFSLLRRTIYLVLITWGGPAGIIIGISSYIVDRIVSLNLSRKTVTKFIANYKKQKEYLEKLLNKPNLSDTKRNNISKSLRELTKDITKLEMYEESLYSEKENERRAQDSLDEFAVLSSGAENFLQRDIYRAPVSTKQYLDEMHSNTVIQVSKALTTLNGVLQKKYPYLLKDDVVQLMTSLEFKAFEVANIKTINNYISTDTDLNIPIATFLPLNLKTGIYDYAIRDYLKDLCDAIQSILAPNYCVIFDGDAEMYKIYVAFNQPLFIDNDVDNITIQQESVHISLFKDIELFTTLDEQLNILDKNSDEELFNRNIRSLNPDLLVEYCNLAKEDIFIDKNELKKILREYKDSLYDKYNFIENKNRYLSSSISEALYSLENYNEKKQLTNLIEYTNRLIHHNDSMKMLNEFSELSEYDAVNEVSFKNNIRMAKKRITTKAKILSDKEKALSKKLDDQVEKINNDIQKATIEKSREKIIKGDILPSASTIIKTAILAGTAIAINPALAVVGAIGSFALSKHISKQQKQYILDEIDINLKIVEKKMQLAESNNDMKALEQLMKLEKKLKRERQRIFYNMKAYYNDINRD